MKLNDSLKIYVFVKIFILSYLINSIKNTLVINIKITQNK